MPNCVVDDPVALHRLVDRRRDRRLGRRREHRDEGDQSRRRSSAPTPWPPCAAGCASRSPGPACRPCPARAGSGEPTNRANRRAMTGPSTATPTNTASAPSPTGPAPAPDRPCGDEQRTDRSDAAVPSTTRRFDVRRRVDRGVAQRLDRRHLRRLAGRQVRGDQRHDDAGDHRRRRSCEASIDGAGRRQLQAERLEHRPQTLRGRRCRRRRRSPTRTTPVNNASSITERITCLRFAPIARNSAVSFVRCATVIENVL